MSIVKKLKVIKLLLILVVNFVFLSSGYCTIPQLINYQGRLTGTDGFPLTGSYTLKFEVHNVVTGTGILWTETQANVQLTNGIFSVQIGSYTSLPADLFDSPNRWLQIYINGEALSPRIKLISVPYAFISEKSYGVIGSTITGTNIVDGTIMDIDINNSANISGSKISGNISGNASNVTGTIAVTNGGTGLSSVTTGYLLFGQGASGLGSDSNLYWNNTNKGLGISTTSVVSNKVHIVGGSLCVNPAGVPELHTVGGISILHGGTFPNRALQIYPATTNNASYILQGARSGATDYWWTYGISTNNVFQINRFLESDAADNTLHGNDFAIASNGYIGVGTTNPVTKFVVSGGTITVSSGGGINISNRLVTDSNGNVGIGTTNPGATLDLGSSTGKRLLIYYGGSGSGLYQGFGTDVGGGPYESDWFGSAGPANQGVNTIGFYSQAEPPVYSEKVRITATGKVGINTKTPDQKLNVVGGNISTDGIIISSGTGNNYFAGKVGISTVSPSAALCVAGDSIFNFDRAGGANHVTIRGLNVGNWGVLAFSLLNDNSVDTNIVQLVGVTQAYTAGTESGSFAIWTKNSGTISEKMRVTYDGKVGIGIADPGTYTCYVNGTGYLNASAWTYSSDRRLKENINSIPAGLNIIEQLRPVKFDYINGEKKQVGFIAQEVQEVLPDIVTTGTNGMLGLKTDSIIPYLVKAIQEQKQEIELLKNTVKELKTEINILLQKGN
jgi:hypothetical protein